MNNIFLLIHIDELELIVGDEILFLGEVEEGWWRGKLRGKVSRAILILNCLYITIFVF